MSHLVHITIAEKVSKTSGRGYRCPQRGSTNRAERANFKWPLRGEERRRLFLEPLLEPWPAHNDGTTKSRRNWATVWSRFFSRSGALIVLILS